MTEVSLSQWKTKILVKIAPEEQCKLRGIPRCFSSLRTVQIIYVYECINVHAFTWLLSRNDQHPTVKRKEYSRFFSLASSRCDLRHCIRHCTRRAVHSLEKAYEIFFRTKGFIWIFDGFFLKNGIFAKDVRDFWE